MLCDYIKDSALKLIILVSMWMGPYQLCFTVITFFFLYLTLDCSFKVLPQILLWLGVLTRTLTLLFWSHPCVGYMFVLLENKSFPKWQVSCRLQQVSLQDLSQTLHPFYLYFHTSSRACCRVFSADVRRSICGDLIKTAISGCETRKHKKNLTRWIFPRWFLLIFIMSAQEIQ